MTIRLSEQDLYHAAQVGVRRQVEAIRRNLPDRHGYEGEGWNIHIEGAAGELAVAKAFGKYWSGSVNTFRRGGDVGKVQVRTRSDPRSDLIVREDDRDEDRFILVIGKAPLFTIVGWMRGREAKCSEWKQSHGNRPGAYFVPQAALYPIEGGRTGNGSG